MNVNIELDPVEVRVLGSLVEKGLTTPDYYPMTASALTNACNQKSNRDPVMDLSESQVLDALESLSQKYLVMEKGGAGGRVPRYAHKLSGTLMKTYDFSTRELGVLAVLFLRGPQTPGEIRARTTRMCDFHSLADVEETLRGLAQREDGACVVEMPREPGRRETRYGHLFGGALDVTQPENTGGDETVDMHDDDLARRVSVLEEKMSALVDELTALRRELKL